jgi:cytoskeleton protein RodZ
LEFNETASYDRLAAADVAQPMGPLGQELKATREKRKLTLTQVAKDIRISSRYLESLEEGRYAELPGGMYNRAFLRSYCEYLDMEPQAFLEQYEAESLPTSEKYPRLKVRMAQPATSWKPHPLAVWSLLFLISVAGLFASRKWISSVFSPYFSHPPQGQVIVEHTPPPPPSAPSPISAQALLPTGPPAPAVGPSETTPSTVSEPVSGTISTSLVLELEVVERCWVSLKGDGKQILTRELNPGEVQSFKASENFYLVLGNAGGVRLKIDGKPIKPLGKLGEVVRTVIDEKSIPDLLEKTTG